MAGNLTPFSRFGDVARMAPFGNIEELIREFGMAPSWNEKDMPQMIRMDVSETDRDYTVKAQIPGCRKEDIEVSVDGNTVLISAESRNERSQQANGRVVRSECYAGRQYRSFSLPQMIDDAHVQATYQDGILHLVLPKKEGGNGKKIGIK